MSAQRRPKTDPPGHESAQDGDWVQVPAVVDANGDKVVTLYDEQGRIGRAVQALLVQPRR